MSIQCDDREIRQLDLNNSHIADRIGAFLADAGLRLDEDLPYFVGMFDTEEHLVGCGGVDGNVIKCIAVATEVRGTGATAKLISHLVYAVFEAGQTNVRVFTKPEYKDLFKSLGFNLCGEGSTAVLLESDNRQLTKYCSYLALHPADGVIVANADPFTLGHLHLISYAAKQSQRLCVIVVGQNQKNTFAYADRLAMIGKTTKHLSNVEIVEGSDYIISNLSFPSYFLKRADNASRSQAEVDLDLFCRHLAPALGCIRRFVGSEPTDELTSQRHIQPRR